MFVYELFAVIVHSGGAYGGHYYSYIKDFDNDKWFNFSDTRVSPMSFVDLVDSFGRSSKPVAA